MTRDELRRQHDAATRQLQAMAIAHFRKALKRTLRKVSSRIKLSTSSITAAGGWCASGDPKYSWPMPLAASGSGVSLDDLALLRAEWDLESDDDLMPFLEEVFGAGALAALVQVGAEGNPVLLSRKAQEFLAEAKNRVKGFGDEMWSQARESLTEGFTLGEGIEDLTGRLTGLFDLLEWQAERIARTEVMDAANQGALAEMQALGEFGPQTKCWLAELDAATDEECADLDGECVGINDDFSSGDDAPPLHANCRCCLTWGDDPEQDLLSATLDELAASAQEPSKGSNMGKTSTAALPPPPPPQQAPPKPKPAQPVVPPGQHTPPYTVEQNAKGCPPEAPWGLVDATGVVCSCSATEAEANEELAEYNSPGMAEIAQAFAEGVAPIDGTPGAFHTLMVIEGVETGDGRIFEQGSLTWRDMPIPLKWQKAELPQHDGSVLAGRVDRIERQGAEIHGWGVIDMAGVDGMECARMIEAGFLRGVSVDVDSVNEADVELVFPDPAPSGGMEELFMEPEQIIFHNGRIAGLTATPMPAFQEAFIELAGMATTGQDTPVEAYGLTDEEYLTAHGFGPTGKSVSDSPWDGSASRFSDDQWKMATASCDGSGSPPKTDCFEPHHEPDGSVSRAGVHAAASRAGQLSGHPAESVARAKAHLRSHYASDLNEDAPPSIGGEATSITDIEAMAACDTLLAFGSLLPEHRATITELREMWDPPTQPEPTVLDVLVAAAIPLAPPSEWFDNPHLTGPTALTVTEDGQVFGHAWLAGTCHTSYPGTCVTPPDNDDFSVFLLHEIETAEGELLPVGNITMTGHAQHLGLHAAQEHYDTPSAARAQVNIGYDEFGGWVAGALKPETTPEQVRDLRAAALSGEWRRIGGRYRLIALAAVNVPGFPVPRTRARVEKGVQTALVAAGIVTPERLRPAPNLGRVAQRLAAQMGLDPKSRQAAAAARIKQEA